MIPELRHAGYYAQGLLDLSIFSGALESFAFSLVIAVAAFWMHKYLARKVSELLIEVEDSLDDLLATLRRRRRGRVDLQAGSWLA